MILSISDVTDLKKAITEKFSSQIHFHDGCGGQYFTIDEPADELKSFLTEYFSRRKLKVRFLKDGTHFSVEELS